MAELKSTVSTQRTALYRLGGRRRLMRKRLRISTAVVKRAIVVPDAQGDLEARYPSIGLVWGGAIDGASMAYGYSQARVRFILTAGEIAHHSVGPDKELSAHFAASVFIGSTLSQLRQRSSDLPVRSVVAISRFSHFGQRIASMESSRL